MTPKPLSKQQTISESNWETFRTNKYLDKSIDSMGKVYSFYEEDIKDFIRQEKQKSFEEAVKEIEKIVDTMDELLKPSSTHCQTCTSIVDGWNLTVETIRDNFRQKLQSLLKQQ